MTTLKIAAAVAVLIMLPSIANAKHRGHRHHAIQSYDANGNAAGNVRSKSGATATVAPEFAGKFQAYINDLEAAGADIHFMGGNRRGHCSNRHMHSCGRALDICQLSRGRVDPRCHLPSRTAIAAIASRHGLFEGGQWCHSDYGHAQVGVSAAACGGWDGPRRSTRNYATRAGYRHVAMSTRYQPQQMDRYLLH